MGKGKPLMPPVPVKSVKKAMDLLSLLVFDDPEARGKPLTELAKALGLPANTTHNLLKTLAACGYAGQNMDGRYIAGPQCRSIGIANRLDSERFKDYVRKTMERQTADLKEAMVFAVLKGGVRVVVARSDPDQPIRIDPKTDVETCPYRVPTGRVLAAFASEDDWARMIAHYGRPEASWPTHATDCERIRRTGECVILSDTQGIHAFAAVVRDPGGRLVGAMGCYAPAFRCDSGCQKRIRASLKAAAKEWTAF